VSVGASPGLASGGPERPRAIVHLDLDAFFAAVEVLDHRELEGKPLLIGGRPEQRGVVATASYAARAYGCRSAMPMARALQLCPEAIVLPPRHERYRSVSRQVMALLRQAAPLVEQVSIDEAYLDLTELIQEWDDAADRARRLQRQVRDEVGLSASLGVATNKLVAKIAADRDKPGGCTVVRPGEEAAFLAPLPVRVLWGVGPVTAAGLAEMGVQTVGELARVPEEQLVVRFGDHGRAMTAHARGMDRRPLVRERVRKSVSQERTFARDIARFDLLKGHLWRMSQGVAEHLHRAERAAGTVVIKVRYADFTTCTRQASLPVPTDDAVEIYAHALALLEQAWPGGRAVRLLGVAGRNLGPPSGQLALWPDLARVGR
jgi:DNA polymerase-4